MSDASQVSGVTQIGETAGLIWGALSDEGPLSTAKLVKMIDRPRDTVMQALGWLRERIRSRSTKKAAAGSYPSASRTPPWS